MAALLAGPGLLPSPVRQAAAEGADVAQWYGELDAGERQFRFGEQICCRR